MGPPPGLVPYKDTVDCERKEAVDIWPEDPVRCVISFLLISSASSASLRMFRGTF